jgi:radical SAM protein with 4Fe4S-binding SPASM domain
MTNSVGLGRYKYNINGQMYRFRNDIRLVSGIRNAALYDFKTGNIYSINKSAINIILLKNQDSGYLNNLLDLGLLISLSTKQKYFKFPIVKVTLRFAWLELTHLCQNNCIHCYGAFGKKIKQPIEVTNKILIDWKQMIRDVYDLGARSIQFIGGEPLLYRNLRGETIIDLIKEAKNVGFTSIDVFSNGLAITPKIIKQFKRYKVSVGISLYSNEPAIHDQITQVKGSYIRTMNAIKLYLKNEIPFHIGFVAMKQNEHTLKNTINYIRRLRHGKNIKPDVIRPGEFGINPATEPSISCYIKYGFMMTPKFKTSAIEFAAAMEQNSCLGRIIAITSTGDVLPCVFARHQVLGNIHTQNLKKIIKNDLTQQIWHTTKNHIDVCKDCEYRYACHDCRPLNYGVNGGDFLSTPPARCTYNPYTGVWGKGTWKMVNNVPKYMELNLQNGGDLYKRSTNRI